MQMNLNKKTEVYPQTQKINFAININTLLYIKQIMKKDFLYSIENYIQYFVITCKGKESEKIGMTESLYCAPEMKTTLKINYTSLKKKSS